MLALAAACSVVTYLAQETARGSLAHLTLAARVANALVSYVAYLGKFVYPVGLAIFYPHPEHALPAWEIAGACLVLAAISAGALAWRRRHPYLLVGWLWYLGMLVPVIGLVQVGSQAMADRYTYLTQIGLYLAVGLGSRASRPHLVLPPLGVRSRLSGAGGPDGVCPAAGCQSGETARRSGPTPSPRRRGTTKRTTASGARWRAADR